MDRERLVKELLYHVRIGKDSTIAFKTARLDGGTVLDQHKDMMAHEFVEKR